MVGAKNCALVAALTPLLACLLATTPAAATPTGSEITHPGDDWAGSQIARHEGGGLRLMAGPVPASAYSALTGLDASSHQGNVNWA